MGGKRTGNLGKACADVVGDGFVCEVKERKQIPQWQKHALAQAESAAAMFTSPMRALVVIHELGSRYADDMIVMRRGDYEVWHGRLAGWRGEGDQEAA
jgi:hypothetical protein